MKIEEVIKGFEMDNMLLGESEPGTVERNNMAIEALKEIQAYRAIGTVEECRTAVERMKPRKPTDRCMFKECPVCGNVEIQNCRYCPDCGQAIDWKEEED